MADPAFKNKFESLKTEYVSISSQYDTVMSDTALDSEKRAEKLNQLFDSCFDLSGRFDDFQRDVEKLAADDLTPADVKSIQEKTIDLSNRIKNSLK